VHTPVARSTSCTVDTTLPPWTLHHPSELKHLPCDAVALAECDGSRTVDPVTRQIGSSTRSPPCESISTLEVRT
jgi:hypothetical protein